MCAGACCYLNRDRVSFSTDITRAIWLSGEDGVCLQRAIWLSGKMECVSRGGAEPVVR